MDLTACDGPPMKRLMLRELFLAGVLLGIGVVMLPFAVYFVGQRIIGEYGAAGTADDLVFALWSALVAGEPPAWLLVLSPYVVWQLLRLTRCVWRARRPVNGLTVSHRDESAA